MSRSSHVTEALILMGASVFAIGSASCGGSHEQAKPPGTAAAAEPAHAAREPTAPAPTPNASSPGAPQRQGAAAPRQGANEGDEEAELVVSRDVVGRCPTLRLVRQHVEEFDPDMVWLAVLESIAECMGQGGPMSQQSIGVSGDEEHRHIIRELLGSRGIAPTRVITVQPSAEGAAECQGGTDCSKRVEITIAPSP